MGYEKERKNSKEDNLIKKTAQEANDLFGHTVDTSGKIVKSVSGEGGLIGKATDASGRILKGTANKANDVIGKTSEAPGKMYQHIRNHGKSKTDGEKD